jgi:RND family efflux transporter MFP subunit
MKRSFVALSIVAAIAVAFAAGTWVGWRSATTASKAPAAQKLLHYACPMHPAYHTNGPGACPTCGMQLEPVYSDDTPGASARSLPPGTIRISPERQQVTGIRIGQVEERPATGTIRTVGKVTVDENRVYRLLAASDGLVKQIFNNSTGGLVRKNELLLNFYTREFLGAQQAYFFALQSYDRFVQEGASPDQVNVATTQIRSAIDTLQNLGMGDIQIAALAKSRTATTDIELRSPVDGCVLARAVTPSQRFDRGAELYRIADLSRIWILADVAAGESYKFQPGTHVRIAAPDGAGRPIEAKVGNILPQIDPATRTLKLRLEADNADYALRPDMFVNVELPISLPRAVTVPVDALVDTGLKKIVFVERGNGYFEPRRVQTGWRFEDRVEILRGLAPGDRIVLSGVFLLDSESRMRSTAAGISTSVQDPVCGMEVDQGKATAAGRKVVFEDQPYYFCSDECRKKFEATPATYANSAQPVRPSPAPAPQRELPFSDPSLVNLPGLESVPGGTLPPQPPVATRPRPLGLPQNASAPVTPPAPTGAEQTNQTDQARPASTERIKISRDPVCGISVREEDASLRGLTSQFQGRTFFFSSADCKKAFDGNPAQYLADRELPPLASKPASAPATADKSAVSPVTDPVCGMAVDTKKAAAAGLRADYKGTTYFFCSEDCKKAFDQEPAKYARK